MPRETASSRVSKKTPSRVSGGRAGRKAPTTLGQQAASDKLLRKRMSVAVIVCVVISFGSVGIGIADEGQIDVESVVEERNQRIASENENLPEGERVERVNLKRQGQDTRPDGGLQGLGKVKPSAPTPTTASSTASSTDDGTASSTDDVAAEDETETSDQPDEGAATDTEEPGAASVQRNI